ncbi:hypothetical protein BC567DRAFT_60053 [Phyllosticta citribraziliensis]
MAQTTCSTADQLLLSPTSLLGSRDPTVCHPSVIYHLSFAILSSAPQRNATRRKCLTRAAFSLPPPPHHAQPPPPNLSPTARYGEGIRRGGGSGSGNGGSISQTQLTVVIRTRPLHPCLRPVPSRPLVVVSWNWNPARRLGFRVVELAGWLVGCLAGWLAVWLACLALGRLAIWLVSPPAARGWCGGGVWRGGGRVEAGR